MLEPPAGQENDRWVAIADVDDLVEASWPDGSAVYRLSDGFLTALHPTSAEVFHVVQRAGHVALDSLIDQVFGEPISAEETSHLLVLLAELESQGLIRRELE